MTQTKAATVAAALINAGYSIDVSQPTPGSWHVRATGTAIDVQTVANFAVAQAVTGNVQTTDFT